MHTSGNSDGHIILRGGRSRPNYAADGVAEALSLLRRAGLPERLVIDASHDNSRKDADRQPAVAADVGRQIGNGNTAIVGVMLESFLLGGRQVLDPAGRRPLTYGQSITDACLDWDSTVEVLDGLAGAVRARRGHAN